MKFNGVESYNHYQDSTIFWVALSNIPVELERKATLIDGENYNETCFGVCVAFSAETQKFDLVVEMDNDEAGSVYYVGNDGDIHWLSCKVPESLANLIFSECQQILDHKKVEGGYEIKECVQFEDDSGLILAENPDMERAFMTAHFTPADRGQRYYDRLEFYYHRSEANIDFIKRTEYWKQFLLVKPSQPQAAELHEKKGKQAKKRAKRPKRKRR